MTFKFLPLFVFSMCCVNIQSKYLESPCPRILQYEPLKDIDRWFAIITLINESDLCGVWIRLIFDSPILELGNWHGDVQTSDNKNFLITNSEHKLKAAMPYALRIYARFEPSATLPKIKVLIFNGKTICPEEESTTLPPITGGKPAYYNDTQNALSSIQTTKPPIFNNVECGTVAPQAKPLITYGEASKEGEFPWHAAIYEKKNNSLEYLCAGTLISNSYLLSVAHCFQNWESGGTKDPNTLIVYLGKYYIHSWNNSGIQAAEVSKIITHAQFNTIQYKSDIALLKFVKPIIFNNYIRPICLWSDDTDISTIENKNGIVVGWGYDELGTISDELQKANMKVVSAATCNLAKPEFFARFVNEKAYCAGFRNGTSVCNGDSGGGMIFLKSTSTRNKKIWQLRGLVSLSMAKTNLFECDASYYVVYTDVAKYLDWIATMMQ